MRIKKSFIAILLSIVTTISLAQSTSPRSVCQRDQDVEVLLTNAANHMIMFILTKDERNYNHCMKSIQLADTMQKSLELEYKNMKGIPKKIQDYINEDRMLEIISYRDECIKSFILHEDKDEKTIRVLFKGKIYKVSKASKALYENFISYVPHI